jgi:hypothetical protein
MRLLITGGCGRLGRWVVEELRGDHEVVAEIPGARAVDAERRDAHMHEMRVHFPERSAVQAERAQGVRRRRLEDEVGGCDQGSQQVALAGLDHDGAFVAVEGMEGQACEVRRAAFLERRDAARRRTLPQFDANDIGAQIPQQHGAEFAPLVREVQYPIRFQQHPAPPVSARSIPRRTPPFMGWPWAGHGPAHGRHGRAAWPVHATRIASDCGLKRWRVFRFTSSP